MHAGERKIGKKEKRKERGEEKNIFYLSIYNYSK